MKCRFCGSAIEDKKQKFCGQCGKQIIRGSLKWKIGVGSIVGVFGIGLLAYGLWSGKEEVRLKEKERESKQVETVVGEKTAVQEMNKTKSIQKIMGEQIKQPISLAKEWIYFQEGYEEPLKRIRLDGSEEENLTQVGVSKWCIEGDMLLYATRDNWDWLYEAGYEESEKQYWFTNELHLVKLDGGEPTKLIGNGLQLEGQEGDKLAVGYNPIGIRKGKAYFEVSMGVPETDAVINYIYAIGLDGQNLKQVSKEGYFYRNKDCLTNQFYYFSQVELGADVGCVKQMDLNTGETKVFSEDSSLIGEYKGEIYFGEQVVRGESREISVYKMAEDKEEKVHVTTLSHVDWVENMVIVGEYLYFNKVDQAVMQNNLTYKKKFNLETRKESPALPKEVKERDWESEEDLVAVDDSYQYVIKYSEEWAEVGELWKISHETHESEQIRTNVKLDWKQIREQFVDKEKQIKQEKKIQKPQEWIYYNTDEAIYRVPIDGGRSEKLFYLGNNTQWEHIEFKNPNQTGIYFCYDEGIYRGDLEGESLQQIVTGNIERVEVKEDEETGKKWIMYQDKENGQTFVVDLETRQSVSLPRQQVEQIVINNNRIFYSVSSYSEEVSQEAVMKVYECTLKGEERIILDESLYKPANDREIYLEEGKLSMLLVEVEKNEIYYQVIDEKRGLTELFKMNLGSKVVESIYQSEHYYSPYLGVEIDEAYIFVQYIPTKHESVHIQLDKSTYEEVDTGEVIGKDSLYLYKLKEDGIYKFDLKTKLSSQITPVYPMYWYDDYKDNFAQLLGEWIYFNDYAADLDLEGTARVDLADSLYRINIDTGEKEEIPKELAYEISWYQATEASKDEKGNYYMYKYNGDQPGSIVKVGADIEEIVWGLEGWNSQIRVIKQ